jgi:hypothetical protein
MQAKITCWTATILVMILMAALASGCGGPAVSSKPKHTLAPAWKSLGDAPDGTAAWFYDANSIERGTPLARVMVKEVFTEAGRVHAIKSLGRARGIEDISYLLTKTEIDCSARAFNYLSVIFYNGEGEVIYEQFAPEYNRQGFSGVDQGGMMAGLVDEICKE